MAGSSRLVNGTERCAICGKPDWCRIIDFPNGDRLSYCHRIAAAKGDTIQGQNGQIFICKDVKDTGFYVYEELSQNQRNLEEWKKQQGYDTKKSRSPKMVAPTKVQVPVSDPNALIEGQVEPLPAEKLDKFYRTFLDLLKLEKKHEKMLRKEWDVCPGMFEKIITDYPIKSIPPADKIRFSSKEKLENMSRKKIMEQLIAKCGEPKGVPYFYQRSYDDAWTFADLSGVCYPVLDAKGRVVRLVIGDEHPVVYKPSATVADDFDGIYRYMLDNEKAGWYYVPYKDCGDFKDPDYTKKVLVYEYGSDSNKVALNSKGYPDGKVKGKYKKASSFVSKQKDGKLYNYYKNGSKGGAFPSLYTKPGDEMSVVYITEGEKKSIVANELLKAPVVCVPGTGNFRLLFDKTCGLGIMDELVKRGCKVIVIAFDADKAENAHVLKSEQGLVNEMKERYGVGKNISLAIGEWNANWGKGIDDTLLAGVKPTIHFVARASSN